MASNEFLPLAVRTVHVLAMALLVGGAGMVWAAAARGDEGALRTARTYEWAFWAAAGALVLTGVGNLGAFGGGLPDPGTRWGGRLALKLGLVLGLLVFSLGRTLLVARLAAGAPGARSGQALAASYAITTVLGGGIGVVAVALAHG